MKKVLALLLALTMVLSVCAACAKTEEAAAEEKPFKVAVVLGVGGLGDGSYNDNIWEGFEEIKKMGVDVTCVEPQELAETMTDHMELAKSGEYDVIFGCSVECEEAVIAAAKAYPKQQFIIINSKLTGYDNICTFDVSSPQTVFPMGVLCGLVTKTNKVGMLIGMDSQLFDDECNAPFIAGVKYVNPDAEVVIKAANSFSDSNLGKQLTLALVEEGCDVVFAYAGGTALGTFAATEEADFWAVGGGSNMNSLAPDKTIASGYYSYAPLVVLYTKMAMEGTLPQGVSIAGLKEGAVGYTFEGSNVELEQQVKDKLADTCQKVIDGVVTVPTTWDMLEDTIAANAGK